MLGSRVRLYSPLSRIVRELHGPNGSFHLRLAEPFRPTAEEVQGLEPRG